MEMGQSFPQILRFCPVTILPPIFYALMSFMYLLRYIMLAVDTFVKQNTSIYFLGCYVVIRW